jgi:hypothetical protein
MSKRKGLDEAANDADGGMVERGAGDVTSPLIIWQNFLTYSPNFN